MYHFLSGYTAKVAGTEKGVTEPRATFSTCFGAPFLPLRAGPLRRRCWASKIARHRARVWLVNTGWTGGPYGVGSRMTISYTRAMIRAALAGELDTRVRTRRIRSSTWRCRPPARTCRQACSSRAQTWSDAGGLRSAGRPARARCSPTISETFERRSVGGCPMPPARALPRPASERLRAGHRPGNPRAAADRVEDLLRLQHRVRRAAEHARLSGLPRVSRSAAGPEPHGRRPRRSRGAGARLPHQRACRSSPARTTSIRICRRAIRSRSTNSRSRARASSSSRPRQARGASGSRASTSKKTPASRCTRDLPTPIARPTSTTTGAARRSSRSSPNPICGRRPTPPSSSARLRAILVWLGVNDGNMEEGSLRCDANVSVRPAGADALGTKAEVKNLNSFRFLQKALEYEIDRQIDVLQAGGRVVQETRLVGFRGRRHRLDAQQGRSARLPVFPGARPAAGRRDRAAV